MRRIAMARMGTKARRRQSHKACTKPAPKIAPVGFFHEAIEVEVAQVREPALRLIVCDEFSTNLPPQRFL